MPDPPAPKRIRARLTPLEESGPNTHKSVFPYAELHCKTNFSFLEGASHPDELVQKAAELRYRALAITDLNSLAGVVRAHVAAKEIGLKLLVGAEITPVDALPVVLLATNRTAYGRLSQLITRGRRQAEKGTCRLTFADVAEFADGLLACVRHFEVSDEESLECLPRYREVFGERCHLLAELFHGADDGLRLQSMMRLAKQQRLPLVAANDVHYHDPSRQALQDVLTAVRHGTTVSELGHRRFPNAERHLKSPAEMRRLFADCPEAMSRTVELANRCNFSLDELRYEYPEELCPIGLTPIEHLSRLVWQGAQERYPDGIPDRVRGMLEYELKLVEEVRYEAYFLTVWDLVKFARGRDILCQGRGSAANSVICYCLGVTSVDPVKIDLLFERFVSKERDEAPDIDIDFEHERREEVIQYVYEKYGRDRAGMTATVISYRPRSAVRDVGKALGYSLEEVDVLAKNLENYNESEKLAGRFRESGLDPRARRARQLNTLVQQVLGFPRHLSQHVGGMVLTQKPLCEVVPIENASMPGRTVIEWDKDDLDDLGILKVDCLALGMLTAIRKGFDLIHKHRDQKYSLATIPPEDPSVYEMIQRADTMGVFQIESRAQMAMLPRLKPKDFYDLVIEVAIVRPGPIQGDMVHPYLRRRAKEEPVDYPDERIKSVLVKTLGVPLFQEQAMKLAVIAGGFTPGEADQLRRAMGAWRKTGEMDRFRDKLLTGMAGNGYSAEFSERLFNQIRGFGEYGFPESHAASFALLVYASAWIKRYEPAVFAAALLNSQPMGFYAAAQLVANARDHGVEIRPVDVNHSEWDATLEEFSSSPLSPCGLRRAQSSRRGVGGEGDPPPISLALRLGLRMVKGLSQAQVDVICARRGDGPFVSFENFARRTRLSSAVLTRLSQADAFGSLTVGRRRALWKSLPNQKVIPLFDSPKLESPKAKVQGPKSETIATPSELSDLGLETLDLGPGEAAEPVVALPAASPLAEVVEDYRATGLSLKNHPMKFLRAGLERMGVAKASDLAILPVDRPVKVAGLTLMRQRPGTASGITFVTLEDETGFANLIVRPEVWERYHHAARTATAMLAHGRLQRQDTVIHILVNRLDDLSKRIADLGVSSRDFH
jgi:error-prone DNA polymerase